MNAIATDPVVVGTPTSTTRIVVALARLEARRLIRSPWLLLGLALSGALGWLTVSTPDRWASERYQSVPVVLVPLLVVISLIVAVSFHRELSPVAADAPVGEPARAAGRLLGSLILVALVGLITVGGVAYFRATGGLAIGDEPGRLPHAQFTTPEALQHVALAVLAVAVGAAAGRRLRNLASAALVLFVGWFLVGMVWWAFQSPAVLPFSIIQVQPFDVYAASGDTDPLTLPASWLLSNPEEFQDFWGRQIVSAPLAGWHDLWLIGLSCLWVAVAVSGRWRPILLGAGGLLAVVSVVAQYAVLP